MLFKVASVLPMLLLAISSSSSATPINRRSTASHDNMVRLMITTTDPSNTNGLRMADITSMVHGIEVHKNITVSSAPNLKVVSVPKSEAAGFIKMLEEHPGVEMVEEDSIRYLSPITVQETQKLVEGILEAESNKARRQIVQPQPLPPANYAANMIASWTTPFNTNASNQVAICVVSSGANVFHPGLSGANIVSGFTDSTRDFCGIGTHNTGMLVSNQPFATARGVKVIQVKVFDGTNCVYTFSSTLAAATDLCRSTAGPGVRLVISLTGGSPQPNLQEQNVFNALAARGDTLVVAAAGDSGNNQFWYPASYSSVISVGAIDANRNLAPFSHRNSEVDLVAPGVSVYSTYTNNNYVYLNGATVASNLVAGAAAVTWSYGVNANWTSAQVRNALQVGATDLGFVGRDDFFGFGMVNVCRSAQLAGANPGLVCPK
ncbi:hypothetical protein HDV05_002506 [Chytridiales sp. JEL 0842]|nr:hypothetical protein HDV05_002506 [Chytridiales sp. JEL 0842]